MRKLVINVRQLDDELYPFAKYEDELSPCTTCDILWQVSQVSPVSAVLHPAFEKFAANAQIWEAHGSRKTEPTKQKDTNASCAWMNMLSTSILCNFILHSFAAEEKTRILWLCSLAASLHCDWQIPLETSACCKQLSMYPAAPSWPWAEFSLISSFLILLPRL